MPARLVVTACVVLATLASKPVLGANAADESAASSATAQREVSDLLKRLGASGCQFYRNGTWYEGPRAAEHLKRKFDYITRRRTLKSAEEFIKLGATESSFSGRAYQVRCGTGQPQTSQNWLLAQLAQLRQTSLKPAAGNTGAQSGS